MINILNNFVQTVRFADFLDIIVITIILYVLLTWIKRRASRSAVIAIAIVVVLYTIARILNMYLTSSLFQAGLTAALVALVLIFQEDIRMALEQVSAWGSIRSKHNLVASARTVECIVDSFSNFARDKIGALVVIKGRDSLDRHLSGGISLGGRLSLPLLYSIFHPSTPCHDGAVIIEGDRLEKFGVKLPLSHNTIALGETGTRHSAALGIAEKSDALIIVASEERGVISIAEQGEIEKVGPEMLRARLQNFYRKVFPEPQTFSRLEWLTRHLGLKIISFCTAILIWFIFAYQVETVNKTFTLPIEYRNLPSDWIVENPRPTQAAISISGFKRAFNFDHSALAVSLDASKISEGTNTIRIRNENINVPNNVTITQINPSEVSVSARRLIPVILPVQIQTTGTLPKGLKLANVHVQPQQVRVLVPVKRKKFYSEIHTEEVELSTITESGSVKVNLSIPSETRLADQNEMTIRAYITVEKAK